MNGHNMMTREDFLRRVLNSGEVTKIAQHLALVIFILSEGKNTIEASARDLERITGWGRSAIVDHLAELEVFMSVTLGIGRGKTVFELQGVIEDAINAGIVSASRAQTDATASAKRTKAKNSVRQKDTKTDTKTDTNDSVRESVTTPGMSATRTQTEQLASASRTQTDPRVYAPARIETPSGLLLPKKENNTPLPPSEADGLREGEEAIGHGVFVNCETVRHHAFCISVKSVAMQLATSNIGVSFKDAMVLAKDTAVSHALQWATEIENGKAPAAVLPSGNLANVVRGSVLSMHNKQATSKRASKPYMRRC